MTLRELNARHSQPTAWTTARHSVIQLELWLVRRVRRRAGPFRYNFTSFDSITTRKWSRWIVIRAQTNQIRNDISTFSGGTTAGPTTRLAREGLRSPLPPPALKVASGRFPQILSRLLGYRSCPINAHLALAWKGQWIKHVIDAVVASAHRLPVFSTSALRDVLLSAIGRLLLPALDFGTVYLLTSGLPRHSQHFVGSWKLIYFGNLTQTLCYNYVAILVKVTLT